jgi:RNA polymerase sigma-70 factor (family 1)
MAKDALSDAELWNAIRNDNYRAFTTLFERYWLTLYKTANHYIKDPEAAEEAVHDLFVNLWKARQTLQIADFKTYLKIATRYEVLRMVKKRKAIPLSYYDELPPETDRAVTNSGYENVRNRELEYELERYLSKLPDRCREIFLLSRKDHLSNTEIAERLGISRRSVENQITAALKYLRLNFKHIAVLISICYLR